jgi:hypothetical protein
MARAPSTNSGQSGNTLSLSGGWLKGESSATDILTIEGHSSQAGDLLNVGTYKAASTDNTGETFSVSASGATRIGIVPTVAIASGSTAYTVLSSNSGKAHIVPGFSSGAAITMPAHSAGLNYKFYIRAVTASGGLSFKLPSTPGTIYHGAVADGATIVAATAADLVGGASFEMISDGTNWYMSYTDAGSTASALLTVAAT